MINKPPPFKGLNIWAPIIITIGGCLLIRGLGYNYFHVHLWRSRSCADFVDFLGGLSYRAICVNGRLGGF